MRRRRIGWRRSTAIRWLAATITSARKRCRARATKRRCPSRTAASRRSCSARNLSKTFRVGDEDVRAVHDVSLDLVQGETLGLVGESGSGKTTLAKLLLGLMLPDKGATLELDGASLPERVTKRSEAQMKSLQIVFQNPDSALNRAHSVRQLIARSLSKLAALHGEAKERRLHTLTEAVRLPERYLGSRTRQLSGGLKPRVAIARAFAGDPAWSCATNRLPPSTFPCRPRSSTCSPICSASGA